MAILTKERKKNFEKFKHAVKSAVHDLIKQERHSPTKNLYEGLIRSIETTGIYFFDKDILAEGGGSRLMGLHQNSVIYIRQGNKIEIKHGSSTISMPAGHLFYGNKLTLDGITTLIHEWAHYPKRVHGFARMIGLPGEMAEEFLADVVSAKVAIKLGFHKDYVLRHYHGRASMFWVYGFNYFKALKKALGW